MTDESATDARAKPETVDERVEYIADLMGDLKWVRGKTGKQLAKEWGLSESAIKDYAAEASRRVTGDPDVARRDITAGASKLFRQAVEEGNAKAAQAMGTLWADVSGAKAPSKHVVETAQNPAEAAAKARALMGQHFGKVTPGADDEQARPPEPEGDPDP